VGALFDGAVGIIYSMLYKDLAILMVVRFCSNHCTIRIEKFSNNCTANISFIDEKRSTFDAHFNYGWYSLYWDADHKIFYKIRIRIYHFNPKFLPCQSPFQICKFYHRARLYCFLLFPPILSQFAQLFEKIVSCIEFKSLKDEILSLS
jgi:hypothetical protein